MSYSSNLKIDPLFVGLTRPTLILGVSIHFAMLNILVCTLAYIQTTNLKIIFLGALLHAVGYILCFKEPRFMELYMNKFVMHEIS